MLHKVPNSRGQLWTKYLTVKIGHKDEHVKFKDFKWLLHGKGKIQIKGSLGGDFNSTNEREMTGCVDEVRRSI